MKLNHSSLLFHLVKALPLNAVLLYFVPSVAIAQVAPTQPTDTAPVTTATPSGATASGATTASVTTGTSTTGVTAPSLPATNAAATPVGPTAVPTYNPVPIYIPVAGQPNYYPVGMPQPQVAYPVGAPGYPVAMPGQNPNNGFSVQVTTSIAVPGQNGYSNPPNQGTAIANPGPYGYPVMPGQLAPGPNGGYFNPGAYPYPAGYPYQGAYPYPLQPGFPLAQPGSPGTLEAFTNASLLPLPAQAFWQQVSNTSSSSLDSQTLEGLRQLVRTHPQFVPGQIRLAQALFSSNRQSEAVSSLQQAVVLYPTQPDLARTLVSALVKSNRWTEAATVARQFAITNPGSPAANEFSQLAMEAAKLAQTPSVSQRSPRSGLLGNLLTAGLGYLLTGRGTNPVPLAPQPTWNSALPTNTTNSQVVQNLLNRVQLVNDADVTGYVNDIGRRLAQASGRSDLQYDFYVVRDRDSSALALPGGKIFVNAGAIANANSEAEVANILARQIGHSMLNHPTQIVNRSNFASNLTRLLPVVGGLVNPKLNSLNNGLTGTLVSGLLGNIANGLVKPSYTSQMNNQATQLGTKLMTAAGYDQGNLLNISTGSDRHSQVRAKVQQLFGLASTPSW